MACGGGRQIPAAQPGGGLACSEKIKKYKMDAIDGCKLLLAGSVVCVS